MASKSFNLSGGWRQGSSKLWGAQVWKKTEWRQPNLSRGYEGATSPRRHIKIACWNVKKICALGKHRKVSELWAVLTLPSWAEMNVDGQELRRLG